MTTQQFNWLGLGALAALGTLAGCQKDPFDGIRSEERAITAVTLDKGQIGLAEITRTSGDTSKATVYVVKGTNLSTITPRIETSYKA
ncbi:MAG: hypothetical protein EOO62_39915, partial [Hymenobacter sp.]